MADSGRPTALPFQVCFRPEAGVAGSLTLLNDTAASGWNCVGTTCGIHALENYLFFVEIDGAAEFALFE